MASRRYSGCRNCIHFAVLALLVMTGCGGGTPPAESKVSKRKPWLVDATEEVGLHFEHVSGPRGSYFLPRVMGSGGAWIDYDQDGRLDLILLQGGGPEARAATNRLFRQRSDGTFVDVSKGSGLDFPCWGTGIAVGDVDNDGWPDVLITRYDGIGLYRNERGSGRFRDITSAAGLVDLHWATSAAFFDYDQDGRLDLFVTRYVAYNPSRLCRNNADQADFCPPKVFPSTTDRLYRNLTKKVGQVVFEDVSKTCGIDRAKTAGLGVLCADFSGDGLLDVLVASDSQPNRLWVQQPDRSFRDEALARGLAYNGMGEPEADMGLAIGDIDGDSLFDVFATHVNFETHTLWRQKPRGQFDDVTSRCGLTEASVRTTGFGTALADFDCDGDLDLAFANGRIYSDWSVTAGHVKPFWRPYVERNSLLANDGKGRFTSVAERNPDFCSLPGVHRGLLIADADNDGDLDIVTTSIDDRARFFRNATARIGKWLVVRVVDPRYRRDAYGATVTVRIAGRTWTRRVNPGYSYQSSNDPRVHFGLGQVKGLATVDIAWPDGKRERFQAIRLNKQHTLERGTGKPVK